MSEVYSFGLGSSGQLGVGTEDNQQTPKLIEGLQGKKVVQVACGARHSGM